MEFEGILLETNVEQTLRFSTSLATQAAFFTDAGLGWNFVQRTRNHFYTLAFNFYPTTNAAFLLDPLTNTSFALITSHSVGAASLASGQLEILVHRRLATDDGAGLMEGCDDTIAAPVKVWFLAGDGDMIH
eukprot:Sdes_comp21752_c0_seq1m20322